MASAVLIAAGIGVMVLFFVARMQFNEFLANPQPNLKDYPLLDLIVNEDPLGPPRANVANDPAERAQMVSLQIYAVGAFGVLLIGAGIAVLVIARRKLKAQEDEAKGAV